ncbi:MAG: tRNA pseudouridine(38-40) synthase TruA [Andreesenia angusta]|nr:tRNA pseudouridine(38-40) synthase TruA [Andreesenia angusta]
MKNIKLTIEYDGTNYCGWQKQTGLKTVEEEVEKAIFKSTGKRVKLYASGRTDAGVHAYGQVANFRIESTIPGDRFIYPLNDKLPDDISVKKSEEVEDDFHSRYSAKSKTYRYLVYQSKIRSALLRNRAYHFSYELDIQKMKRALEYLVGRMDYSSFTPIKSNINKNIRTIYSADVFREAEYIVFEISGNGFLHNMVRIIVGTVLDIGNGHRRVEDMKDIIEKKDRLSAGKTVPAYGLYLKRVEY